MIWKSLASKKMDSSNHILESTRIDLQKKLDSEKNHTERNKLGQFATPTDLAKEIVRSTKPYLPRKFKIRFLDPAFGTGAFYSALVSVFSPDHIESADGIEIDAHYGHRAQELWAHSRLRLQIDDFFRLKPAVKDKLKPNLIVCNPPYVRHHHIPPSDKEKLQRLVASTARVRLNGLAGLYCYFLLYAHTWLQDDGLACWLIPSEFMDVNYGAEIKQYLLNSVTLLRIHRFDASEVQFGDALVSSSVVWFKKKTPKPAHEVEFTFGGSLSESEFSKTISIASLKNVHKWNRLSLRALSRKQPSLTLSDLFVIKRGLATGANYYFILSLKEARKLNLPSRFLIPILPSPRYLKQNIIEANSSGSPILDDERVLLSCSLPESQVKQLYLSLWQYYQRGIEQKVHRTYICSHRSPWYSQESRPPCPILCTYMGRQATNRGNPFRFILNYSNATAANVYLLLYPKPVLAEQARRSPDLFKRIWETLNQIPAESLLEEGRVYGGGLHKLEPKELSNANADFLVNVLPELANTAPSNEHELFSPQ
jgi:adenine-specific DNA-methyltransferase